MNFPKVPVEKIVPVYTARQRKRRNRALRAARLGARLVKALEAGLPYLGSPFHPGLQSYHELGAREIYERWRYQKSFEWDPSVDAPWDPPPRRHRQRVIRLGKKHVAE